jgi:hypothetical protein
MLKKFESSLKSRRIEVFGMEFKVNKNELDFVHILEE